jgi:MFS family permease
MEVVSPDERSAAAGITAVARSIGATLSPMLGTMMISNSTWMSVPFFIAGGLKIVYDILLYQAFVNRKSDS